MSTHSAIITKIDNKYHGIYCHWDGYPDGVGKILKTHYQDSDKIHRLIDLGDISILGERVEPIGKHSYDTPEHGTTVAYHRDRGEDLQFSVGETIKDVLQYIDYDYYYVWENGSWYVNGELLT